MKNSCFFILAKVLILNHVIFRSPYERRAVFGFLFSIGRPSAIGVPTSNRLPIRTTILSNPLGILGILGILGSLEILGIYGESLHD